MERTFAHRPFGSSVFEDSEKFDFIINKEAIFQALTESKVNGNVIGIYSPVLGKEMFITGVEDIMLTETDTVIILKEYDMSGFIFEKRTLNLSDIISVCPFTSPVKNPFLSNLEKDTDWYTIINA